MDRTSNENGGIFPVANATTKKTYKYNLQQQGKDSYEFILHRHYQMSLKIRRIQSISGEINLYEKKSKGSEEKRKKLIQLYEKLIQLLKYDLREQCKTEPQSWLIDINKRITSIKNGLEMNVKYTVIKEWLKFYKDVSFLVYSCYV